MSKIKDFFLKNKQYTFIFLAILGICLIGISYMPKRVAVSSENSETIYEVNLEKRVKEIIEKIAGNDTTEVMITLKNTYIARSEETSAFSTDKSSAGKKYDSIPTPDIAGVMIVCTSLSTPEDFLTVKQAVSTCLDIPQSKIYIIGGASNNEKNN